jgi:negative regulator of flagellin synthesis FlgM
LEVDVKIDDSLTGASSVRTQKTRNGKGKYSTSSVSTSTTQDSVEITQTSAHLSILEDKLSNLDTSESSKLDAVKQAIAEGRFHVDEEAVADALVQNSMESLKRQGRK